MEGYSNEDTLETIAKTEFDDVFGPKVLQKREQKIVKIMADDTHKDEAAHLFRMMSTMPASRRMSVMPGVKVEDDSTDKMGSQMSRRASIMPQKASDGMDQEPIGPKKKAKKSLRIDESGGTGFLEMIQYHIEN